MQRRISVALVLSLTLLLSPAFADVVVGPGGGTPGTSKHFKLIGHEPLFNRGMNAAPTVFEDFVYIGNRTDGQARHPHPGILVVDASDPSRPEVVNEIGSPHAANIGETTRELRVWPEEEILIVLNFRCSPTIHDCPGNDPGPSFRFFSLEDPANPEHLMTYIPKQADGTVRVPHEFYLWVDPKDEDRVLLWASAPTSSTNPERANLIIYDISDVPDGVEPTVIAQGNWNHLYEGGGAPAAFDFDLALHSMAPTADGKTTHLAYLRGHYLALDTTKVAEGSIPPGTVESLNDDLLTQPANRPRWGTSSANCPKECAESHSAVPVPGRPFELSIDEVYGTFTDPSFGCPWSWARLIDVNDPTHPRIVGEYKTAKNQCPADDPATEQFTSYGSHNPTVLPRLAFIAWHSSGLQAINISNPSHPEQTGWFSPTPLSSVATEDPALSGGPNKVVMWSYPIIKDGLIYVVDIRNGLYILRYRGPGQKQVQDIDFLEGNSNLGDAVGLGH